MSMFHAPYRWSYPRVWSTNVRYILNQLISGIKNVVRWAPVIWDDQDYDWAFLAKIMEYKLRRSSQLEFTFGHHTNSARDGRNMLVCAELLKRLREDRYYEEAKDPFDNKYDEVRVRVLQSMRQSKSDQEYLGKMIGKWLTFWWD